MPNHQQCKIALQYDKECNQRCYNLPTAASNKIVVHPLYQALHYVLLFPTGQFGWTPGIPYVTRENEGPRGEGSDDGDAPDSKRSCVTQTQYFHYQLFP